MMAEALSVPASAYNVDIGQLILRLLSHDISDYHSHVHLTPAECLTVCHLTVEMLKTQDICLVLQSPLNVVGDIHGQFHDLLRLFDALGKPPDVKYLFLGDYVDRGKYSLEVMMMLMSMMLQHPQSVFLLRGNHETGNVCCRYGFRAEILQRYPKVQANKVLGGFLRAFQWLPLCAIVDSRFLCCHGGVSPSLLLSPFDPKAGRDANLQALSSQNPRPLEPRRSGLAMDLLWSDPASMPSQMYVGSGERLVEAQWVPNSRRQCSFVFSAAALNQVLRLFHAHLLVRGHQVAQSGFKVNHDKRCITIFSAPGYCGVQDNAAAILQVLPSDIGSREAGTLFVMKAMRRSPADVDHLFWTELNDG